MTPPVAYLPLPYEAKLELRELSAIDLVVIHCTELPDLAIAREYGERVQYDSGTGNSGHYYIDRDGSLQQYVALSRVAHHVSGWNPRSIGIELVNRGRYPHWLDSRHQSMDEAYPMAQINGLLTLLQGLSQALPSLRWITGHDELDTRQQPASDDAALTVARKRDPGPLFPWSSVLAHIPLQRLPR